MDLFKLGAMAHTCSLTFGKLRWEDVRGGKGGGK